MAFIKNASAVFSAAQGCFARALPWCLAKRSVQESHLFVAILADCLAGCLAALEHNELTLIGNFD